MLEVTDIYKTSVDPLAKVLRKKLREYNINKLKVVYSREKPLKLLYSLDSSDVVKKNIPASLVFVPAAMGLTIAAEVIKDLTGIKNDKPGA
jgi:tRNA A37 threonylcarbamoyladenosine dehydratase